MSVSGTSLAGRLLRHPITVLTAFALVVALGIYLATLLPVDQFPEVEMPVILVRTSYPGAAAEEVERNVTRALEGALAGVAGLDTLSSTSSRGSSLVTLQFAYGRDLDAATNDVRDCLERVQASLPDGAESPSIFKFDPNSMPILMVAVRGDRSLEELHALAEDSLASQFERIDGVATAAARGGGGRIVRVAVRRDRLEAYGLALTSVASALAAQNSEGGSGEVRDADQKLVLLASGAFGGLEDLRDTLVATRGGRPIRVRDVADVAFEAESEDTEVYINGSPGVTIEITKESGSNSIRVADAVKRRIAALESRLPEGVRLEVISDMTTMVRRSVAQVANSAWQGVALTVVVLLLFLRRLRTTLIVALSIPVAIVSTIVGMYFLGISFNMISLTGLVLALGMVVDGSIVFVENIYRYREKGTALATAAVLGSREMTSAVTGSTLTTVCVFLPLVLFHARLGVMGQLVRDLAFTVVAALLASLAVAVMLVPVLAGHTLPIYTAKQRPVRHRVLRWLDDALEAGFQGLRRAYQAALRGALHARFVVVAAVAALLALTAALAPRVGFQFAPAQADDMVQIALELPVGTPKERTRQALLRLEAIAREEVVGIQSLVATVGSGGMGSSGQEHRGSLRIQLSGSGDNSFAVQRKLRAHYGEFPDAVFSYGTMRAIGGGSSVDVVVHCDDLARALAAAEKIRGTLQGMPEVNEPRMDIETGQPQLAIVVDRERAFDLGVSSSAIAAEISAAVSGATATVYRAGGEDYDVVVILAEEDRATPADLLQLGISNSAGRRVPLASVATVERSAGPVSIRREQQERVVHVTASMARGAKADQVEARVRSAVDAAVAQDEDLRITYEGSMADTGETGRELAVIALMALVLVFAVMAAEFESFADPFIVFFTVPVSLVGVVLVHLLLGEPLSIVSGIGVVVLIGVAVNNGIVLVDYTNLLRARGRTVNQACLEAGGNRLRPVLMTTLTTVVGMIPMAFFPGEGAEMVQPIGRTLIGGLVAGTFVTLFLVPVVYSLLNRGRREERRALREAAVEGEAPSAVWATAQGTSGSGSTT